MAEFIDITGNKYGKWTVVEYVGESKWKCICECGTKRDIPRSNLVRNHSSSCGCKRREKSKKHKPLYNTWHGMMKRCYLRTHPYFNLYGGRGIKVCELWKRYENFERDMGDRPPGHSLDRIDNNGDYCPENCRWASRKQQTRNRRSTLILEHNGKKLSIGKWSEIIGIPYHRILNRINKLKWSASEALSVKKRKYKRRK